MDEETLIAAAQRGDADAFEQLLDRHYDTIYRFALKWCGSTVDAEDIAQLACIKLARSLAQFQFNSAFTTWLYRLVINCAKDWQREQRKHHSPAKETPAVIAKTDTGGPETGIYLRQVLAKVSELGEEFKETLVLVFGEGMTHSEAASVLNVKESTISWRIHNVRKRLSLLDESGDMKEGGVA